MTPKNLGTKMCTTTVSKLSVLPSFSTFTHECLYVYFINSNEFGPFYPKNFFGVSP